MRITIVGAGLAGSLLATLLARRGFAVEMFEKRPDPRLDGHEGGRSINMALAERGLHALTVAGLRDEVMAQAVMMRGRMVHGPGGAQFLRYGADDTEVIWSIHRGRLNAALLDAAEAAGARIHFRHQIASADFDARTLCIEGPAGATRAHSFDVVLGCDGAGSTLRDAMERVSPLGVRFDALGHGYKELEIPPSPDGDFRIDGNALHIWPCGGYMCIALPNTERSFTVTLFLPNEGARSFAALPSADAARELFARDFPDALPLISDFERQWSANPVGSLGTLRLDTWRLDGRALLLGDAAHAMVPFHGQGMNCAFEDCVALDTHIAAAGDLETAFAAFEAERRPNADAIQQMALENYVEMRDSVAHADFLLQRAVERVLAARHPGRFVPRYTMVTFTQIPYAMAFERGRIQREILVELTRGCEALDDVDLHRGDTLVAERLAPIDVAPVAEWHLRERQGS